MHPFCNFPPSASFQQGLKCEVLFFLAVVKLPPQPQANELDATAAWSRAITGQFYCSMHTKTWPLYVVARVVNGDIIADILTRRRSPISLHSH